MKTFLISTLIWAAIAVIGAVSVVGFGLYNVSARQGHLLGVSWVLHTAYRNAVLLRAPAEEAVPDLSSTSLIDLGRGHYQDACVFCHAEPGEIRSQTALSMVPQPPHVTDAVSDWEPRHLFWIVKNGVKMSGMPAWPSDDRDDHVWAVVAYLNTVKRGETIAITEADPGVNPGSTDQTDRNSDLAALYQSRCARCHSDDGFAENNVQVPRLDTLSAPYIEATLLAYRNGARQSGIMQQAASQLSDTTVSSLATHIADLAPEAPNSYGADGLDQVLIARGDALAHGGDVKANIPSCVACHGPGRAPTSVRFPPLAGQSSVFLFNQLKLWKSGKRGGTDRANLMHEVVPELTEDDMQALAQYYASQPPSR